MLEGAVMISRDIPVATDLSRLMVSTTNSWSYNSWMRKSDIDELRRDLLKRIIDEVK